MSGRGFSHSTQPPVNFNQQSLIAGSPVSFNILKERLKSSSSSIAQTRHSDELSTSGNPFLPSSTNPSFNPQKVGSKISSFNGVVKPTKEPEPPTIPSMRFAAEVWDEVQAKNPNLKMWEVGKMTAQMWIDLSEGEKQPYVSQYESERSEYEKLMMELRNNPAYQAYFQAKLRGTPVVEESEPKGLAAMAMMGRNGERRIDIQPAEDASTYGEEGGDESALLTIRHLAQARFSRNHLLIHDICSAVVLPDVRSVVTSNRMQVLKRQVNNLTMHQHKLEGELKAIHEKYESKKKRFEECTDKFNAQLIDSSGSSSEFGRPVKTMEQMVQDELAKLKRESVVVNTKAVVKAPTLTAECIEKKKIEESGNGGDKFAKDDKVEKDDSATDSNVVESKNKDMTSEGEGQEKTTDSTSADNQ